MANWANFQRIDIRFRRRMRPALGPSRIAPSGGLGFRRRMLGIANFLPKKIAVGQLEEIPIVKNPLLIQKKQREGTKPAFDSKKNKKKDGK